MADEESITVAESSEGPGGYGQPGEPVSLPVVELLTGRGFITGKSGSGKSNSASVVAENLLDNGFGLLIVDIDGEYYGLKEEYEILHAGADEECDIQVTPDHAEKLAALALEQNVPIILDVSSYLDEDEAEAVLTAVARHLFAKAKKQKQPFLLLVEEVHEYIPENGSVGECGKMLIKIGKRGRKHGLGIVGISQRPADVKKDFITQCDWLVWHRLTWNNDTKVVRRILDGEYATAVEDLDDGEAFLTCDWAGAVRRVQFHRKQTFDAGATPGLEDVERPDLKSVSSDLVSELEAISDETAEREDRIAELREELDRKNSRIAELEAELQDARDLSRMADQFVSALLDHVEGARPGLTERERMRADRERERRRDGHGGEVAGGAAATESTPEDREDREDGDGALAGPGTESDDVGFDAEGFAAAMDGEGAEEPTEGEPEPAEAFAAAMEATGDDGSGEEPEEGATGSAAFSFAEADFVADEGDDATNGHAAEDADDERFSAAETLEPLSRVEEREIRGFGTVEDGDGERTEATASDGEPLAVRELKADIAGMETRTREMLDYYREQGPETPLDAHFAAGGDGDRNRAYAHNRRLRTRGLIEHVGRGRYDYRLRALLRAELAEPTKARIERYAERVEEATLD
jgi:hypothetical protein